MDAESIIERLKGMHPKCMVKIVVNGNIAKLVAMQSTDTNLAYFSKNKY